MALRVLALQHAPLQSNPSSVAVFLPPHAPLQSHPLRVSVPSLVHFLVAAPDPKRLDTTKVGDRSMGLCAVSAVSSKPELEL